jgi:hypothetical protein
MIFGSLEQNLPIGIPHKPSDETLKQGRNRDNGMLNCLTLCIDYYTLFEDFFFIDNPNKYNS